MNGFADKYWKEWFEDNGDEELVDRYQPDGYNMRHIEITPNILYDYIIARFKAESSGETE